MFAINKKSIIFLAVGFLAIGLGIWYWAEKNVEIGEIQKTGVLFGHATVGPICPVERAGQPCPVPPEAYTSREVLVYDIDGKTIVSRQHFAQNGNYRFQLPPGEYLVDTVHQGGLGSSRDLPKQVSIKEGQILKLDIDIDTGIR
jgi:hypothetical protein